jgi:hypothetical protein
MSVVKQYGLLRRNYLLRSKRNSFYNLRSRRNINYFQNKNTKDDKQIYRDTSKICQKFSNEHRKRKRESNTEAFVRIKRIRSESLDSVNAYDLTESDFNYEIIPYRTIDDDTILVESWDDFNVYQPAPGIDKSKEIREKDWVSPSNVKNYMLWDPILDWFRLYYLDRGFNEEEKLVLDKSVNYKREKDTSIGKELNHASILCEMGNRFEYDVIKFLKNKYKDNVRTVASNLNDLTPIMAKKTLEYMKLGIPIIDQAVLYNRSNRTCGVADIVIRSDWINKLFKEGVIPEEEETIRAPLLNVDYHYLVIDIKWTTLYLCSNGKLIRNSYRFPSYKAQLAIYNAAIGQLQGYTSDKSYILAKSYKYTCRGTDYNGYDCFNRLGEIDYSDFDKIYLDRTYKGINWIRNVRYNGKHWKCLPPSIPELYPNMSNQYDSPYHEVKKDLANKIDELTDIWMIGPKNRFIAHSHDIFKWSDPDCNSSTLGLSKKRGLIVDKILNINRSNDSNLLPLKIRNNDYNWQEKEELDLYIDFEVLNKCFLSKKNNLSNCKEVSGLVFLVGIGYEMDGEWKYKKFLLENVCINEEKDLINKLINFIEGLVDDHIKKHNIKSRNLCYPRIFHWSHAELTFINNANKRHNNIWSDWIKNKVQWVDFCRIFQKEPITIKGVKNFKLKEVAKQMYKYNMIESCWDSESSVTGGLSAMMEAIKYYKDKKDRQIMDDIVKYNEMDCKTVYEIVNYLREKCI